MNTNQQEMLHIYENVALTVEEQSLLEANQKKGWRMISLTADWCGDAMLCVPIMKRITEVLEIDMRFLIRDENLELMDQYLTNGTSRSIPIFILIDEQGQERAVWGPRAPEVQQMVTEMRKALPPQDDPTFAEKQKEMIQTFRERISNDTTIWDFVKSSIIGKLLATF
jgi:hypothetical protein